MTSVPARSNTSVSHSGATDVGITLRVTDIRLPRLAQQGPIWSATAQGGPVRWLDGARMEGYESLMNKARVR